ncbi:MAG: hypothetical protein M3N30_10730 [Bacteroidota bacterium]|nr:hypothetical protein [Bacteroidota bacterium]
MKRYSQIVLLPIFVFCLVLSAGCKKSVPGYQATGSIIGPDSRVPACGGGTWIQVDGHPNPGIASGYYDMGTLPAGFQIDSSAKYPVKVELDYSINVHCPIYIDISRIKVIN